MIAGKITMYEIVVVEIASESTTVKYFSALPPVIVKAPALGPLP